MIDITSKIDTLRSAIASAELFVSETNMNAVRNNQVPKGDVFASAKAAGLLAIKNTSHVLPHCHPIPVEFSNFEFNIKNKEIIEIKVEVRTIYKTGCEMEALHGVSVAALTVYDMLKPVDKLIEIRNIKLLNKTGGKSDNKIYYKINVKASVLVISDTVKKGRSKDESGNVIRQRLKSFNVDIKDIEIVQDDIKLIQRKVKSYCKNNFDLVITTGGTGVSPRDCTHEAIKPLIELEIPGIMESARAYGQKRMPYSMLSRGIAGFIGDTLILTFPGSPKAAGEYMDSLFPYVLHLLKVKKGFHHS